MRILAGALLGVLIGSIAAALWYGFNFLWNGYIYDYVAYFLSASSGPAGSRGWDGQSFNLIQLLPIVAGMFIFYLAVGFLGALVEQHLSKYASSRAASWTAAAVLVFVSLAMSLLLALLAYAGLSGFAAFFLYAYALGMFLGPAWAAVSAARSVHRGFA